MRWLTRYFRKRQRHIDMTILWPVIKEKAETIDKAREAFNYHTTIDSAWSDLTNEQRLKITNALS